MATWPGKLERRRAVEGTAKLSRPCLVRTASCATSKNVADVNGHLLNRLLGELLHLHIMHMFMWAI